MSTPGEIPQDDDSSMERLASFSVFYAPQDEIDARFNQIVEANKMYKLEGAKPPMPERIKRVGWSAMLTYLKYYERVFPPIR